MTDWRLVHFPRKWQEEALGKWLADSRGIIEVVTGGGKTIFAFQAMQVMKSRNPLMHFLIVVPVVSIG